MSALEFFSAFFSPTYLFLFLNIIIGAIFITSCLGSHRPPKPQAVPLTRTSSSLFDRVRSFDLSLYKFDSHPEPEPVQVPLARTPSLLDRLRSFNFYQQKFEHMNPDPEPEPLPQVDPPAPLSRSPSSLLERVRSIKFPSFYDLGEHDRDSEPDHDDANNLAKDGRHGLVRRIRSESERMGEQEGGKRRMRKTASEQSMVAAAAEDNEEVEAINVRADDFIQRFRHQLRLQRLDSIKRYKDMLARGH